MAKNTYYIHSSKRVNKQIYDNIPKPCAYLPENFGLNHTLTGKGIKIGIVDSGLPDHPDIGNIIESVDVSETTRDKADHHGHSTMVSGIISANNPKAITGIAPDAELLFAKVINQNGEGSFNSLIAGILWCVVKQVDIILLSLGSSTDYPVLHDAIKKAYDQNICVIAASGNGNQSDFPARYPEVLSVEKRKNPSKNGKFATFGATGLEMVLPDRDLYTTYLHGRYTKASGTSLIAAMGAGLAALVLERDSTLRTTPNHVYFSLSCLGYKQPAKE